MHNIFEISNLRCSYKNSDKVVLEIEELKIPAGKLSVLLGISGVGKSTFLETLGLMNRTFLDGSLIKFFPKADEPPIHYENLSSAKARKDVYAYLRNRYFSFIFQSTNLMANFTVYENICLSQMIQGKSYQEALANAHAAMQSVGLEHISNDKKPYELSGGQQQRVAFVRAITADFTVLFGDEPTGNLDEDNSHELIAIIKKILKDSSKAVVIVSHNIDLAVQFADHIIVMQKEGGKGVLKRENVFLRDDENTAWKNLNGLKINDIRSKIKLAMHA